MPTVYRFNHVQKNCPTDFAMGSQPNDASRGTETLIGFPAAGRGEEDSGAELMSDLHTKHQAINVYRLTFIRMEASAKLSQFLMAKSHLRAENGRPDFTFWLSQNLDEDSPIRWREGAIIFNCRSFFTSLRFFLAREAGRESFHWVIKIGTWLPLRKEAGERRVRKREKSLKVYSGKRVLGKCLLGNWGGYAIGRRFLMVQFTSGRCANNLDTSIKIARDFPIVLPVVWAVPVNKPQESSWPSAFEYWKRGDYLEGAFTSR